VVNADSTQPSVTIVAPANGATVSGGVVISANASDSQGLAKVRFWAGSTYVGFDSSAPFSMNWNSAGAPNGPRVLRAQAVDWANNTKDATVTVTVANTDDTPPSVTVTAPADGATVAGNVTVSAAASDNGGIQKVRFWAGSSYLGFDQTAPYSVTWDSTLAPNGPRVLRAQAVDMANNTTDDTANVTIENCLDPEECGTQLGGCPVFPADNPWNTDISNAAVHERSAQYIASFNQSGNGFLHADFGGDGEYGIPYLVVPESEPGVPVEFVDYGDESDPGPYPIPLDAPIEGGSDRHTLALQEGTCKLYELFVAEPTAQGWEASSGAIFDLRSNALRPEGWTSADAAGLPILPGLAKYDEAQSGEITHALRVTVGQTQRGYIHPATHWASSSTNPNLPPMGLRLRLRADYDISGYTGDARVILEALKKYGLIVADNGTSWYITGAMDPRWDDDDLNQLKTVPGTAFEAVDTGPIVTP
jgi:hypothetical protein